MRKLSDAEKKILEEGAYAQFWQLMSQIIQEAIHEEAVNQLQLEADKTLEIQKVKSRREALEEVLRLPKELSKEEK